MGGVSLLAETGTILGTTTAASLSVALMWI